jgi:phosphoglycolate phosphatase
MICRMTDHNAVLFDLDGVLVDSRVPFVRSVNSALVSHGLTVRPEHELIQYLGPPLHQTFRALVDEETLVQPCVDVYRARYREMSASETIVFPGIREILDGLAGQLPLLVATSKPCVLAEPLLDALDLRGFFAAVIGPELDSENEHKAVTVGRAIQQLPHRSRPVMVGDRKHDIAAAHEHDILAIGVLWGIGTEVELRTAGADALARTTAELETMLATSG